MDGERRRVESLQKGDRFRETEWGLILFRVQDDPEPNETGSGVRLRLRVLDTTAQVVLPPSAFVWVEED